MKRIGCIVGVLAAVIRSSFLILPALVMPKTKAVVTRDRNHLRQIWMACEMHAMDHRGAYPDDFRDLIPYADSPKLYVSHLDRGGAGQMSNVMDWTSFVY